MVICEIKKRKIIPFISILFLLIILSGCVNIKCAYIPDEIINNGWYENLSLRNTGLHFLGLEKWCTSLYEIRGKYPASLSISTLKSLLLTNEDELFNKIQGIIEDNLSDNIKLNHSSRFSGERYLSNSHQSKYIIYNGIDLTKELNVRIIGEVWNCGISGLSVICIGIAYITNKDNFSVEYTKNWQSIVSDPNGEIENYFGEGLIYNINCH